MTGVRPVRPHLSAPAIRLAGVLAFAIPLALLAGAYISQYGFDLFPCEMCWWQRYPHFAALAVSVPALVLLARGGHEVARAPIAVAAVAILISGVIGGFHAGVEYGWWTGITECATTSAISGSGDAFWREMMAAPVVRCDVAPFTLFGISLAGFNFFISCAGALAILWLLTRREHADASRVSDEGA